MAKKRRDAIRERNQKIPVSDANEREPLLGVSVGKKGIGKTHETLMMIRDVVRGSHEVPARRALIFDVNNEFSQIKSISLSEIKQWSDEGRIGARRIRIFKARNDANVTVNGKKVFRTPTGKMTLDEMASALFYILERYHDGLLLVEDINKYVSDSLPNDLVGALVTQRHRGVDVIIHFQTIGKYGHPKIVGNANWLRFHKVSDKVKRHKEKFGEYEEPLSICEKLVDMKYRKASKDKRAGKFKNKADWKSASSFFVYWDVDEYRIKGNFTKKEFYYACLLYLQANYNSEVKPKLNQVDMVSGKAKYGDRKTLIATLIRGLVYEYYGN